MGLTKEAYALRLAIITGLIVMTGLIWPLDGLVGFVFVTLLGEKDDTEYATGYSDWRFRSIHAGMSAEAVRARLGAPLEEYRVREPSGEVRAGWRYSRPQHDGSYRIRAMLFRYGRVTEVFHEFYLD